MSKKQAMLLMIRISVDLIAVAASWVLAYFLRFYSGLDTPKGIPNPALYFKLIPFIAVIWFGVLSAAGFYKRSLLKRSAFLEGIDILQSCAFATLAFIAFTYFYEEYRYSRITLVIFALIHPGAIITGRSLIRKALRYYRRNVPPRELLIVGSGEILLEALRFGEHSDFSQAHVLGVMLVGDEQQIEKGKRICQIYNLNIIPVPSDWPDFFSGNNVQTVYFCLPHGSYPFLEKNLHEITNQVTDVKIVPDLMRYTKFAAGIEMFQGTPVINIHESPLEGFGSVIKRILDVLGSAICIAVLSPVLALIAILVKITSQGPVFYHQERMGLDGKTFYCLKFRSMPINAEQRSGPVWASKDNDRSTAIGRVLRRFSLDELPQLFNVLRGEMSLVGPRPERPVFVNEFRKKVPGYMLRHKVKAGITGWAQVNGWRGNTSIEKRIEYDLFYIQNWSLWLDLRILGRTIAEVLFSKNAY